MTEVPERALIYGSGVAFLAYAGASIAWSPVAYNQLWAAVQLAGIGLGFATGLRLPNSRPVVIALLGLISANSIYALWDLSWGTEYGFEGQPGFMGNPNIFGCFLVVGLACVIAYNLWGFLPPLFLGFCMIQSRGAFLAAGAVGFIALWQRFKVTALIALVVGLIIAVELSGPHRSVSLLMRMGIWQDTLNHLTLWGSGFGSFFEAYPLWPVHTNMTLMRASHAYNDFLELLFELGLGAITLWVLMILSLARESPARLPCFAFFALALTYSPLTLPVLSQIFAFFLGQAAQATLKGTAYGPLATYGRSLSQGAG